MIKVFLAPLLGGVIGYITNDLAIRMLFHPRKPVYIGKLHVPMTPGLIPSQKARIARSIGRAVSRELLNEDTLRQSLLTEETLDKLKNKVSEFVGQYARDERTVRQILSERFDLNQLQEKAGEMEKAAAKMICAQLLEANVGYLVVDSFMNYLLEKGTVNLLASLFMDQYTKEAAKKKLAAKVNEMIADKAPGILLQLMDSGKEKLLNARICDLYARFEDKKDAWIQRLMDAAVSLLSDNLGRLLQAADIEGIVEKKINSLDEAQLEALIFGLMSRELKAIVYLGAVLGTLMGFINLLF